MFTFDMVTQSLQMDFSAMYTAGKSLNYGLNPYSNNIETSPIVWDGIAYYKHSRFLYPPFAANLFQFLGMFNYFTAKWLWTLMNIGGIGFAVWISAKSLSLSLKRWQWAVVAIVGLNCYPLYVLIERGQIDGVLIGLLSLGVYYALRSNQKIWLAGALLALATLLKLYLIFLLPFFLLRKQWKLVSAYVVGGAGVILLTICFHGWSGFASYVSDDLPRIIEFREGGPRESLADQQKLIPLYDQVKIPGHTVIQGRDYIKSGLDFKAIAGWTPVMRNGIQKMSGGEASNLAISVMGLGICLLFIFLFLRKSMKEDWSLLKRWLWLMLALVVTLFIGPITWTMSMVWLIPLAIIPVLLYNRLGKIELGCFLIAFALLMLPDKLQWPSIYPDSLSFLGSHYNLVQLLLLTGIIRILAGSTSKKQADVA